MSNQQPSVGRVVHYQAYGTPGGEYKSVPRAAIITEVHEDGEHVGLCVLNPTGQFFNQRCPSAAPISRARGAGPRSWRPKPRRP